MSGRLRLSLVVATLVIVGPCVLVGLAYGDRDGSEAGVPGRTWLIGDSFVVDAADPAGRLFGGDVTVAAADGDRFADRAGAFADAVDDRADVVIVQLGLNDLAAGTPPAGLAERVEEAMDATGRTRCVVWGTYREELSGSFAGLSGAVRSYNAIVRARAVDHANVRVADFAVQFRPSMDAGDGLHLTVDGSAALAELYQRTTNSCPAPVASGAPVAVGNYAFPLDRSLIIDVGELDDPHHDYPAWDFGIPVGTPVFAVHGGIAIHASGACGNGVTVVGDDGASYVYCHGSRVIVANGARVGTGQQLMLSGNTGRSTGPHLHLGITIGGVKRCPQPLLIALHGSRPPPAPATLPGAGCIGPPLS